MSVTFPCYCRVLDAFKPDNKKDQMPLKKGEFVRVLRADETGVFVRTCLSSFFSLFSVPWLLFVFLRRQNAHYLRLDAL
jgi:hypothetical protein